MKHFIGIGLLPVSLHAFEDPSDPRLSLSDDRVCSRISPARSEGQLAFEEAVVDFFVDAAELLGIPKSVAAIYGAVFASSTPLSPAEIEARLGISKGSVSQGLRMLRGVGAVREVSSANERVERFIPDLEIRRLIGHLLASRLDMQLQGGRTRLKELGQRLEALPRRERTILASRLYKLRRWHSRTRRLLPIVRAFLKL